MVFRYAFNIKCISGIEEVRDLLDSVSAERRERISRFRFEEDKLRCLFAEILLRYALHECYGLTDITIVNDKYGKPYLPDHKDIFFNLSHSGDWVVCALGDLKVGIDVEKTEDIDLSIADEYFAQEEKDHLNHLREKEKKDAFYTIWTLKESYTKNDGRGMGIPLDSFAFLFEDGDIELYDGGTKNDGFFFLAQDLDESHKMALCMERGKGEVSVGDLIIPVLKDLKIH